MAKSPRKKPVKSTEPSDAKSLSEPMTELAEKLGLTTAAQLPSPQKSDEETVAAFQKWREREQAVPEGHAAKIAAERHYRPVPEEYLSTALTPGGIRVYRKTHMRNGEKRSVAAMQFPEDAPPTRDEKDFVEALQEPDHYAAHCDIKPALWERESVPGDRRIGENTIDMVKRAEYLDHCRKTGQKPYGEGNGRG